MSKSIKGNTILINDDCRNNYPQLSERLVAEGFKVSVKELLNILITVKSLQPDLILLDISHLGKKGLEIGQLLRKILNTQDTTVILIISLTQSSLQHNKQNGEKLKVVIQPARIEDILVRLKTHLALQQVDRQLHREISNRCHTEALLEESQQSIKQQFGSEIWELMSAKHELETSNRESNEDRELVEFAYSVSQALQTLQESLAAFTADISLERDRLSSEEIIYLKDIADSDSRMKALVKDLLAYATVRES